MVGFNISIDYLIFLLMCLIHFPLNMSQSLRLTSNIKCNEMMLCGFWD